MLQTRFPDQANGTNPLTFKAPDGRQAHRLQVRRTRSSRPSPAYAQGQGGHQGGQPVLQRRQDPADQGRQARLHLAHAEGLAERADGRRRAHDHRRRPTRPRRPGMQVAAGGYLGQKVSKPSSHTSEVVGIVAAIVILLFTFGIGVAMGLPIGTAIFGLVAGSERDHAARARRPGADDRARAGHDDRPRRGDRLRAVRGHPTQEPARRRDGDARSRSRAASPPRAERSSSPGRR